MPRKLCFATLLVFSLLIAEGTAQQFASSNFGKAIAAEVSSRSNAPIQGDVPQSDVHLAPSHTPSHLLRPGICQTPDRYVRSVQQANYTEPSEESPDDREPASTLDAAPLNEFLGGSPPDGAAKRDLGFPTLGPPGKSQPGSAGTTPSVQGLGSLVTVASSLAIVLGLFLLTAWLMRRTRPGALASLPADVFEVLGRAPLNQRQQVHLVRCGTKLLLVSLTPDSAETLTEIDDPDEVTRLAGLCKSNQTGSASAAFRQVLHQFAGQPVESGFIGRTDSRTRHTQVPSDLENLHG